MLFRFGVQLDRGNFKHERKKNQKFRQKREK